MEGRFDMISQPLCSSFGSHQRVPAQRCRAEAGETLGGPASSVTRGSALSTVEAWNHPDLFALLSAGGASSAGELAGFNGSLSMWAWGVGVDVKGESSSSSSAERERILDTHDERR